MIIEVVNTGFNPMRASLVIMYKIVILGQDFDMSPERFTLDNMFAMELHKYQDVAEQIVNHAIKVVVSQFLIICVYFRLC